MEIGHWVTIGIFVITNLSLWAGIVISIRVDMRGIKVNMEGFEGQMAKVEQELKQFGTILVTLADFKGEINLIQERLLAQGKRLDEEIMRSNRWRDEVDRRSAVTRKDA